MTESRREFLIATGALVGGFSAHTSTVAAETSNRIRIGENEPILAEAITAFDHNHPDIDVETFETNGFEEFLHDEVDVQYAVRPMTTSERGRAQENNVGFEKREFPLSGVATIAPDEGWCHCLSKSERESRTQNEQTEIWSEVTSDVPNDHVSTSLPEQETTVFVRGTRGHQYAIGHGGIGYHEASPSAFEQINTNLDEASQVIQLGFAYVNHSALNQEATDGLVDSYQASTGSDIAYIQDPN